MVEIVSNTAAEQIHQLRSGEVGAEELVSRALEMAKTSSHLNAFLVIDADQALTKARKIDNARRTGSVLPALAGLPICVKDNIDVEGWVTSGATPALATLRPQRTAPVVRRLLDAGAILLGKTNLHELAFGITNTNFGSDFPPARNPHDPQRITGGSSGGTAAAIAAGIVCAGLGTDTSGSIRIPAALCGIAGLRPTVGDGGAERRYPLEGILPISHTNDTAGPMGAQVADIALLDEVITGEPMAEPIGLHGLRLGMPECFWSVLDSEVEAICREFCQKLSDQGAILVNLSLPDLRAAWKEVSTPVVLHEPIHDIPTYLINNGWGHLTIQDIRREISNPDVRLAFDTILSNSYGKAYGQAVSVHRPALRKIYRDAFREHALDALVFPTVPIPAPLTDLKDAFAKIEIPGLGTYPIFDTCIRNTDPSANAGLPGLNIPIGATRKGLPVGIELDGWIGSDLQLLGIGITIEKIV